MSNTIIEVNGLVKKFGDFVAVKDVSFTMQEGDVFGLLGPNGRAKAPPSRCSRVSIRPAAAGYASLVMM